MKLIKKTLPLFLLAAVLCVLISATPLTAEAATSGYYTYTVSNGEAAITDCDSGISGNITIPSTLGGNPVTTIGSGAFWDCDSLTGVTIPDSVTTIGDYAFRYCSSLTGVTIPDSVTTIGDYAFRYCSSLTGIWVEEGNTAYSSDVSGVLFDKDKTQLIQAPGAISGSYTIPDSVTTIGDSAFDSCDSLTSVTIPDSVTTIGEYAFCSCDSLTSVKIPDSVTTIGDDAFSWCTSLTSVTIPDSVTTIGEYAFCSCDSLTSVTIPDSVTTIGGGAFCLCDSLTGIWVEEGNTAYSSDAGGVLFNKDKTQLIQAPGVISGSYTIPDSVTTIGGRAFSFCDSLTMVTIPDSVTTIGNDAFSFCDSLTSVTIPDSVTTIGDSAFSSCDSLTSVTIGDSVTTIGDSAFSSCDSLTSVTIGDSVTTIGDSAFRRCDSLTSVTIPDSVTTIGDEAFELCDSLTSVTIPDSVTTIGDDAFCSCDSLTSVTIGDSVTTIGNDAFSYCTSLTTVTIPDSVTTIYGAFDCCTSLTGIWVEEGNTAYSSDVSGVLFNKDKSELVRAPGAISGSYTIPDSVTTIGTWAFNSCDSLTTVTIPDSVTTIGYDAFSWCTSLTTVTIGDSVTTIGYHAFDRCTSLKNVYYMGSETQWAKISIGSYNDSLKNATLHTGEAVVIGIAVETLPEKTQYLIGEDLDTTGLTLTATWTDSTTEVITSGFNVSGFDSATPGTQVLTVTYEGFTATFEVTVKDPVNFEIVSQPASVEITAGFVAQFTVEATDAANYKWQYRRNESRPWISTTLPGYATATLSVPAILARNGYQYRCVVTGSDGTVLESEYATLTVNDSIFITTQPTRQIVGVDTSANFTVEADGSGLTYQWLYRKHDEDFWKQTGMTGNKTASLTVPAIISRNGYQYMCAITDENGIKIYTKVAVLSTIGFTVQPADQTAPMDTDAVFTVAAKGQDLTYKWQYRKTSTSSWLSTSLPGYDTDTLTVLAMVSRNGYQYRCAITDALGTLVYSDPATLTVDCGIEIITQPESQRIPVGLDAVFTVEATGNGLTYQWQYRQSTSGSWYSTSLPGYNTDTLIVEALKGRHGYQYRCVITDANGISISTEPATLSVRTTILIHTQPEDQCVAVDTDAVFSLFATGVELTYQWQYRAPGGTWCDTTLPGYDTNTLTVTALAGRNDYQYRCQLTDAYGKTMQSHTVVLTVDIPEATVTITAQPTDQTVYIDENAVFSVAATGEGLTYQWQYQKVGTSANWLSTSLTGATTDTLTVAGLEGRNGYRYRCVIADADGVTLVSDSVTLTVNNPSAEAQITSQPTDQTVAAGENAKFSVAVTGSDLTYQWQYCSGADSGWISTSMTGAKTNTLTVAAIAGRNGYQYRCVITDANGYVINTDIVTLTVE